VALLAVSSGVAHREHIGVEFVFARLPASLRRWLAAGFDALAFLFLPCSVTASPSPSAASRA
tara:strand:- start:2795 stop:2980 length:186 start_codon:yes stop_codon:yes gene_type:complete